MGLKTANEAIRTWGCVKDGVRMSNFPQKDDAIDITTHDIKSSHFSVYFLQ